MTLELCYCRSYIKTDIRRQVRIWKDAYIFRNIHHKAFLLITLNYAISLCCALVFQILRPLYERATMEDHVIF